MHYSSKESELNESKPNDLNSETALGIELPNGKYRGLFIVSSSTDPFIFSVQWILEMRHRLMAESFK